MYNIVLLDGHVEAGGILLLYRRWNKSSDDCVDMLRWPKLTDHRAIYVSV